MKPNKRCAQSAEYPKSAEFVNTQEGHRQFEAYGVSCTGGATASVRFDDIRATLKVLPAVLIHAAPFFGYVTASLVHSCGHEEPLGASYRTSTRVIAHARLRWPDVRSVVIVGGAQ